MEKLEKLHNLISECVGLVAVELRSKSPPPASLALAESRLARSLALVVELAGEPAPAPAADVPGQMTISDILRESAKQHRTRGDAAHAAMCEFGRGGAIIVKPTVAQIEAINRAFAEHQKGAPAA